MSTPSDEASRYDFLQTLPMHKVWGWSMITGAVLLATAFAAPIESIPERLMVPNLLGPVGTILRDIVVRAFGMGAFFLCFVLVDLGQARITQRRVGSPIARILGTFVAMFCLGALCQALWPPKAFPGGEIPIGGTLGHKSYLALAQSLDPKLFGLTMAMAAMAGIVLATEDLIAQIVRGIRPRSLAESAVPDANDSGATSEPTPYDPADALAAELAAAVADPPEADLEVEVEVEVEAEAGAEPAPAKARATRRTAKKKAAAPAEAEQEAAAEAGEDARTKPTIRSRQPDTDAEIDRPLQSEIINPLPFAPDAPNPTEEEDDAAAEEDSAADDDAEWEEGEWDESEEGEEGEWEEGEWAEGDDEEWEEGDWEEGGEEAAEGDEEWEEEEEAEEEDPEPAPEPERQAPAAPKIRTEASTSSDALSVIRLDRGSGIKKRDRYPLPPLDLLAEPTYLKQRESDEVLQKKAANLEAALADFNVEARVTEIERGPVITRFDLELSRGTRISKVTGLADDVALTLGVGRVRIAPVKGKSALGVEVPNKARETVFLRDVAVATEGKLSKIAIPLYLGKDASGMPLVEDLSTTPHLLIAGRTGAGKSVFVNSLILSVLLTKRPEDIRLIMIDPKKVELEVYQDIPHLLTPVESNPKRATKILEWAVDQMEERYELLAACGVRHLVSYNKLSKKAREEKLSRVYSEDVLEHLPDRMPYVVIIVDELADLMMASGKEVENAIARLAQKARAVGIHVVLATQRPSTDVITGLIKSNLPARIAFQTRTGIDSRTILDRYGAEKLLDKGDMLYLSSKSDDPRRIQGPFVSDEEVEAQVRYLRETASPFYVQKMEQVGGGQGSMAEVAGRDELFDQAVEVVMTTGQASASFLQRRMQVGYARASRLIDIMAEAGLVSEHRGSKAREILVSPEQWEEMRGSGAAG